MRLLWTGLLGLGLGSGSGCASGHHGTGQLRTQSAAARDGVTDPLRRELTRLESAASEERRLAANRLAEFPQPAARGALEARLGREEDPEVREAIQRSLTKTEP